MLPATGAALATTASLIGGINVDDPNVVPSVKAKKLLRTLVLGAAAGLGAEAMLRGSGIAYRGLMSKSSSAEQIKRFRNKTLYSLIKQAEPLQGIDPIENVGAVENQAEPTTAPTAAPTTPTPTPTQPPVENNPLAPPATTTPDTAKETPAKEPWHRQSPLGIPNGYIGYGLGTLAGAGLLYHFLTEKKKRKPSGYLNSMGAGLLAGLLGYGLYDLSQGGFGTNKTTGKNQPGATPVPKANIPPKGDAARLAYDAKNLQDSAMSQANGLNRAKPAINWNLPGLTGNTSALKQTLDNVYYSNDRLLEQATNGPTALQTFPATNSAGEVDQYQADPEAFVNSFKNKGRQELTAAIEQALIANNVQGNITNITNGLVDQMLQQYNAPEQLQTRAIRFSKGVTQLASTISSMPQPSSYSAEGIQAANARQAAFNNYVNRQATLLSKQLGRNLTPDERNTLATLTGDLIKSLNDRKAINNEIQAESRYLPSGWKDNFWNWQGSKIQTLGEVVYRYFHPDMTTPDADFSLAPFTDSPDKYRSVNDLKSINNASIQTANTKIADIQTQLQNFYAQLVYPEMSTNTKIPGLDQETSKWLYNTFPEAARQQQQALSPESKQNADAIAWANSNATSSQIDKDPFLNSISGIPLESNTEPQLNGANNGMTTVPSTLALGGLQFLIETPTENLTALSNPSVSVGITPTAENEASTLETVQSNNNNKPLVQSIIDQNLYTNPTASTELSGNPETQLTAPDGSSIPVGQLLTALGLGGAGATGAYVAHKNPAIMSPSQAKEIWTKKPSGPSTLSQFRTWWQSKGQIPGLAEIENINNFVEGNISPINYANDALGDNTEKLLTNINNPKVQNAIDKLEGRLAQIDDWGLGPQESTRLKQQARLQFLSELEQVKADIQRRDPNRIYDYWRDNVARPERKIIGENGLFEVTPNSSKWKYTLYPEELKTPDMSDPVVEQLLNQPKPYNETRQFSEIVAAEKARIAQETRYKEIEALVKERNIARANGDQVTIERVNAELKNKYGIEPPNGFDTDFSYNPQANTDAALRNAQELENVNNKRIMSLVQRHNALVEAGDEAGASKIRNVLVNEFGVDPYTRTPVDPNFKPTLEQEWTNEIVNQPKPKLDKNLRNILRAREAAILDGDSQAVVDLNRKLEQLLVSDPTKEPTLLERLGIVKPNNTLNTNKAETLLGRLLSGEPNTIPVNSPEPVVRPATSTGGSPLASDSAGALTGQQQKAVENFRPDSTKPIPHRLTSENFDNLRKEIYRTSYPKIEETIQNQLRSIPTPHDRGVYLDQLMREGIIKPEFNPQVDVIMPKTNKFSTGFTSLPETKVTPKAPKATKPRGIAAPAIFVADLLARGIEASKDDAARYGEQVYDYRISVGDSHEEAQKIAKEAYNDVLQELTLQRGINHSPSALMDWTIKAPQHLRNLNEWLWSYAGIKPNYWTTTNTDAVNLDSLTNGRRDEIVPNTIDTIGKSTVDSIEAGADLGINLVKKPVQAVGNAGSKLLETSKSLSELDRYRRTHNPDGTVKYRRYNPESKNTTTTNTGNENISPEIMNTAVNLAKMDPVSRRVNMKLLPEETQAIIYDILSKMPINGQLLPL